MKSLVIALTLLPGLAGAAEFADLQKMDAAAITRVNPFPNPSNPDSCYLTGMKDDLCQFKCRSGETFLAKPVKPQAAGIYEKCGGGDYRGAQPPDAGAIWNQINNQHNPFPQPQATLDYCVFNDFKNNKCIFKCQSGAILTEPAVKPDFSAGDPAGPCATMIIRPIQAPFHTKAAPDAGAILAQIQQQQAAQQQAIISQQMQFALQAAASLRKDLKGYGVKAKVGLVNLPDYTYGLSVEFAKADDYELVEDLFFQDPGEGPNYMDHKVLVTIAKAAAIGDAKALKVCWLKTMEKDSCVYACKDGSVHTQPMQRPNPWEQDQAVIPCPQLVFPF